jgi:catechol 2,3-dioxygenase-like lactoylglutathione lyase family enzyme
MQGWIHHIDVTVSDLRRSTEFYDRVLPRMGFRRLADCEDGPLWAGASVEIGLQMARANGPHDRYSPGLHHLAFGAPSREAVDELWQELERLRVEIFDAPEGYDRYAPGYYAVFFADPDGIKFEYVFTPEWPV